VPGIQSAEAPALVAIFLGLSQLICLPRSKKLAHFEFPGSKPGFCLLPNLHQKMIAGKEKQVSVLKQLSLDLVLLLLLLRPLFK
jgi:hypothetical protein